MRLFEVIVSILVGGFAVTFALPLFVEESALSLQVLVVLVLLLLAFVVIKYWNSSGATIKYKRVLPPLKDEKPLNTTDLNKILTLLEKYQYSGKSYYRLGLSLGLFDRTLDVIKANNNNSIEDCLREVLTKWLEKADNVEKPTWSALVAALRSMNHNAVAEGIDRETDPVSMIIENHRDALSQSIQENLTDIARLLSFELKDKNLELLHGSPSEKTGVLLKIVKNAVYENYKSILKFADVLCKFPAVRSIGNDIHKNYSETIVDNSIEVKIMSRNGDPIKVPLNFSFECKEMRNKWAIAVECAIKVTVIVVEEEELKGFLQIQTSNSDIKEKLNACHSMGEIMQIIIDHCSLVDLTLLEGIIERFKIEEAKEHINEYKEIKDDFCEKIPLRLLLNETIGCSSSLQCETLHFLVDKSIDERTLKDVQDIIAIAFESFAPNVRVVVIKEGNSFTITCSFPLALSESLIATALKNLEQLKKEGLIKLTIGYCTVYSQNKVKNATVEKLKKLVSKLLSVLTWSTHSEREKSQYITSVYNSSGTVKQLLVSLTVQLINSEATFNEERNMLQDLLEEKTALVKKLENEGDTKIQELKLMIEEKQVEIQVSLQNATKLNEVMQTQLRISRAKDQEIKDLKAAAARKITEKTALVKKIENEGDTRIQELKLLIEEKQDEIKALQVSLQNATVRENIAAEDNKALNERIETHLRISRTKDQEIDDLKAAAIREKIEMMKTEKDNELQIEALKTAIKENEKIIEQSRIKNLSIIISEKDKAIAELQQLIMGKSEEKMKHEPKASRDLDSQIKQLNAIIREKDKTIAELQHLDEMAHLEEISDSDYSPHLRQGPSEIEEDEHGLMTITNPSLKACQDVITQLKIEKNHHYLLEELSPGAARLLIPALLNARNVQTLTIRNTLLTSDFILSLSSQLSRNRSIWDLKFQHDTIDDDGVIALVYALKDNTRVTELSVSYNSGITSVSVQPLKEFLLTNQTHKTLYTLRTNIDTDGVLSLIETLQTKKQIEIWMDRQHEQACSSLPYYDTIKERLTFLGFH